MQEVSGGTVLLLLDLRAYAANTVNTFTGRHPSHDGVRAILRRRGMEELPGGWWRGPHDCIYGFDEREVLDAVSELASNATA